MALTPRMRTLAKIVVPFALIGLALCLFAAIKIDPRPLGSATPVRVAEPDRIDLPSGHTVVFYGPVAPTSAASGISATDLGCALVWDGGSKKVVNRLSPLRDYPQVDIDGTAYFPLFELPSKRAGNTLSCTALGAQSPLVMLDGGSMGAAAVLVKLAAVAGAVLMAIFALGCLLFLALSRSRDGRRA